MNYLRDKFLGCDEVMLTIIANWIDKETSAAAAGLPAASYT